MHDAGARSAFMRAVAAGALLLGGIAVTSHAEVKVVPKEAERRVDITIDGKPFTSYI
jgi:hypothetical protein